MVRSVPVTRRVCQRLFTVILALTVAGVFHASPDLARSPRVVLAVSGCGNNGANAPSTREQVLQRARSWLNSNSYNDSRSANVPTADKVNFHGDTVMYSQDLCHTGIYGSYRQDCSGYIAMSWGLGGSGDAWYTGNLLPGHSSVTFAIGQSDLAPGDALIKHDYTTGVGHAGLFVRWVSGGALVYEESGDGHPAVITVWGSSYLGTFTPTRYNHLAMSTISGGSGHLNLIPVDFSAMGWYDQTWNGFDNGVPDWVAGTGWTSGIGFNQFEATVENADTSGVTIFGVNPDGTMQWYHYDYNTGWDANSMATIGSGWNGCKFVFSGQSGIFYCLGYDGQLLWNRYTGTPGHGGSWYLFNSQVIGTGWTQVAGRNTNHVFAINGTIYLGLDDGSLRWYRYMSPLDGSTTSWALASGAVIGTGWTPGCGFQEILGGGFVDTNAEVVYAIDTAGNLKWFKHQDVSGGSSNWASVSTCGNSIGVGWL